MISSNICGDWLMILKKKTYVFENIGKFDPTNLEMTECKELFIQSKRKRNCDMQECI